MENVRASFLVFSSYWKLCCLNASYVSTGIAYLKTSSSDMALFIEKEIE